VNIYEKLAVLQSKLKAPKAQYNGFGKYNYRSCEDILEAVKPLLNETKTVITISDDLQNIGERYYIKATVKIIDLETLESIENIAFAREEENKKGMDGSQVTGACSSYARKYALNGLFAIDDTKDSDATNNGEKANSGQKNSTKSNVTSIIYKCDDCGKEFKGFTDKKGNKWTAGQVYAYAKKVATEKGIEDDKVRCSDCVKKLLESGDK